MIDNILKALGVIRISQIDKYFLDLYPDNLFKEQFDSIKYSEMVERIRKIPEFKEYCDWTAVQDTKRFYNANHEEHGIIRGAIGRTRHFRSLGSEDVEKKLPIQRYG